MGLIREDLPRLSSAADFVVTEYYQVITALVDRAAGPPGGLIGRPLNGSVFVIENPTHVVKLPPVCFKDVVAGRETVR
jgi:hypothetical protein